jgi:hypothetical protein
VNVQVNWFKKKKRKNFKIFIYSIRDSIPKKYTSNLIILL